LQMINRATNAISLARTFEEVINTSLESSLQVVRGCSATIFLRDIETPNVLEPVASSNPESEERRGTIPIGEGLVGWVASTAKSQLVVNPTLDDSPDSTEHPLEPRSIIAVPLISSDEVIGVLEVTDRREGVFDEQDLEALESLAASMAGAIENVRLLDQTRRRITELSTLLDASAAVSSTLDFGDILERIARRLSVALQVDRVLIANWYRQSNHLETMAEIVNVYWSPGQGPVYHTDYRPVTKAALESGKAVIADEVISRAFDKPAVEMNPSGLRAAASFPIKLNNRVTGVLTLYSESSPTGFTSAQANVVTDVIHRWGALVQANDVRHWLSRANLTDLCQQALQAGGMRWCSVAYWDRAHNELRLLREIGRALWLEQPGTTWDVPSYPSVSRALETGDPLTLQLDQLAHDPREQDYLQSVGGVSCLLVPLFSRGEASGLVKLIDSRREPRIFDNAELSLCQGIANVVSNAIDNAQLYAAQEQRASALEAAYTELQEADQLKDELLQNLSHELRTPLTHILGYLRLISDGTFGPLTTEQQKSTVQLVIDKAQHLADLVKDIVTVQETEAHNLEPKPIHLERVVALSVRSIAGQAQARSIRIVPHIPANLPLVYADPTRIGEVFEELLENAIKFSPNSTQVEVTIEDPGGPMIHASVRDYGIGIHPDEQERIFRRFYQVDRGTTRRFAGTGLGLAIVRQVVEGHKGRVWVESQLGHGSCFHLTLPKATSTSQDE